MSRNRTGFLLAASIGVATLAVEAGSPDFAALGREVVGLVEDQFFDRDRASRWAARHAGYADEVSDAEEFSFTTNEALAALETSHTRHYRRGSSGYQGLIAIFRELLDVDDVEYGGIGVDMDDRGHVRRVLAAGPAEAAGVLRGDRIATIDGRLFDPIDPFAHKAGMEVRLGLQRVAGDSRFELIVTPRRIDPLQEWLEAQREGARLIVREEVRVAYLPLLWCAGEAAQELMREQLARTFRDADALVLDLRDGWGGCNPEFVNYFNTTPPVMTLIDRDGERLEFDPQWRKPLFLLINGGTRSGKEAIAHAVRRHGIGTLVGATTAGFVVGGRPYLLSDGSLLYLAVMDVLVDGERLEGIGVAPDLPVADRLEFAAGADPQLDRAVEAAVRRCRETGARNGRHPAGTRTESELRPD